MGYVSYGLATPSEEKLTIFQEQLSIGPQREEEREDIQKTLGEEQLNQS